MITMRGESRKTEGRGQVDAQSYARAILNILDDFGSERAALNATQKAVLNILDDAGEEKLRTEATQKALLNMIADFNDERDRLAEVQKAVLNIIDDMGMEKLKLEAAQKATLNILEDFDVEKNKVERINREMAGEIVERKRAEEALLAANKELEAFSYSVSHDLRTPLRAIDGFARILLEEYRDRLDDEGRRLLNVVRDNTVRMAQLIDDILSFSRMGRLDMALTSIDMQALVREVSEELLPTAEGRNIVFEFGVLPPIRGDRNMIRQVFINLISNAIKFTRTRQAAMIEIGASAGDGEHVYAVRDNGVGFDMRYADKLFGVFQRLHGPEEFEGTGIGLAIVRRVIDRHGGRVWAEGRLNEGATFYFAFPAKEAGHD